MGTIRFTLRTEFKDKNDLCQVRVVYSVEGIRQYHQLDVKVREENWDQDTQQIIYLDRKAAKKKLPGVDYDLLPSLKEVEEMNGKMQDLRKLIKEIETRYQLDKVRYDSKMVIKKLKEDVLPATKKSEASRLVFAYIDKYLDDKAKIRKKGSLSVYRALREHLSAFEKSSRTEVTFQSIDPSMLEKFQVFLNKERNLVNTTVAKQLSTLKTFLNYARKEGIPVSDKYKDFTVKRQKLDVVALTQEEFDKILSYDFSTNKKFDQVRDVFCFSCATGLRYSDLKQLSRVHIKNDEIKLTAQKTSDLQTIPLNPVSRMILAKYAAMHRPLPVISNAKMNEYLNGKDELVKDKEGKTVFDSKGKPVIKRHHAGLCEVIGLNELVEKITFKGKERIVEHIPRYEQITAHVGRKTFVTLSLERGASAEEVMSITGHQDYKSFKRYVKITEARKKVVMEKAWGKDMLKAV